MQSSMSISAKYNCRGISKNIAERFYGRRYKSCGQEFYDLIRGRITDNCLILDLGAGPGSGDPSRNLRMRNARRIGLDIDPSIKNNSQLDAKLIGTAQNLPFSSNEFDLIFADYVLEHIANPKMVSDEVYRILKPGGHFLFRTTSSYHYSMILSRATSYAFHKKALTIVRRAYGSNETYPTYYRFNTERCIKRTMEKSGFSNIEVMHIEKEPVYLMFHWVPMTMGILYERFVNSSGSLGFLRGQIFVIATK
jgi:ubiquinone/menaquinone biosynthesis C-methylase UbiE